MTQPPPLPLEPVLLSQPRQSENVGNAAELTVLVPYEGLTPHRWTATLGDGLTEMSSNHVAPSARGVGQGGVQRIRLALGPFEETEARFELRAPWDKEPAEIRILRLRRR